MGTPQKLGCWHCRSGPRCSVGAVQSVDKRGHITQSVSKAIFSINDGKSVRSARRASRISDVNVHVVVVVSGRGREKKAVALLLFVMKS